MTGNNASRRKFLKKAAIGTVSVVAAGTVAKKIVSVAANADMKGTDSSYLGRGDKTLEEREYVEMGKREKVARIKMFVDDYKYEAV